MFPGPWFHFFDEPINGYRLFFFLGVFPGLAVILWMARQRQLPLRFAVDAWALCLAAAVTGGWLFYALFGYGQWFHGSASLAERLSSGGTTSMGALAGILFATALLVWRHRDARGRPADAADIFPPAFAIYDAVARLGCFSVGCCHGKPAFGLPWAVEFPMESACVYRGIPVHPTQLYMVLGELVIAGTLLALALPGVAAARKSAADIHEGAYSFGRMNPAVLFRAAGAFRGHFIWLWMIGYGGLRFTVEFFRGDGRPVLGPLTVNQWICLGFIAVGAVILARHFGRRKLAAFSSGMVSNAEARV